MRLSFSAIHSYPDQTGPTHPSPQCTQSKRTISLGISITIIPLCQSTPLALHWSPLSVVVAPDDDDDADAPSDLPLILRDVCRSVGGWLFGLEIRTHSDDTNHYSWQCNIIHKSVCQTNVIHSDEDGRDIHRSSQGSRKENHHQHVGMQGSSASCTYVRNAEDSADSRIIIIFPW